MNKLKEKLNSKKNDGPLYGDLFAIKLQRLSNSSKLRTKHEIGNIIFKYMLQNEEDHQTNVEAAARDQFTSPSQAPSKPIQANSPVYHQPYQQPLHQQQAIPNIKTISKYQLFSNTRRNQYEPKPNFYRHA